MITQELLDGENWRSTLREKDLDTTNFILSLYESDDIDISEAYNFLKNYVTIKTPIEELALKFIAHNFQYYKQANDTIIIDLGFDNVYCELLNHSTIGYYALLKEFMPPYTDDWELKQVCTYVPPTNLCNRIDSWVSKKQSITIEWETSGRMLATIICDKFDQSILSLNKQLYEKLEKENLALFFDVDEFEETSGYDDYRVLKNILL
jgi:hypothetical protein